jgi:DNA-binding IclR family transcriptional regulator
LNTTLTKGLRILELLAQSEQRVGITVLAERIGAAKSNTHRILQTLVELGYADHRPQDGSYGATIRLWELGSAVLAHLDLRRAAFEWMEWLLERSRETVHLSVLDEHEVVYVHKIDSPEPVRAYTQIGGRSPAHCVATGKAMLAWRPESVVGSLKLSRWSDRTITDRERFEREMARTRELGYAVNRGEWRASVGGVAAPISNGHGEVVAAVGLSGPIERMKRERLKMLAADVVRAAQGISSHLAGRPASLAKTRINPTHSGARTGR